jgi:hypothetical protein
MKALIICPAERPAVAALARRRPLVLTPWLGQPVLARVLAFLASAGAREILVLATDRPELLRRFVGCGEAWGVKVEVVPEARELSVAAARAKYQTGPGAWLPAPHDVFLLDRLPQLPTHALWESYAGWQQALLAWLPQARAEQIGLRELSPGVFTGLHGRVAESAQLRPPCWIGANVWLGARTVIGPEVIIEDDVYVDEGAEISQAVIGPKTYVGALTEVRQSLAWGRELLNLTNGSLAVITDHFLLGELGPSARAASGTPATRAAALLTLLLTSPVLLLAWLRNLRSGRPLLSRRVAVRSGPGGGGAAGDTLDYFELAGFRGKWRRWPQLWSIVRGQFAWVGNRPLAPEQVARLSGEFDQLWLTAPTGLFSLADTLGLTGDDLSDEARAHAGFYAVDPDRGKNRKILWRVICNAFRRRVE